MNRLGLVLLSGLLWVAAGCAHRADTGRADFLKLIDRPRVELQPQVKPLAATNGVEQFHFSFASDAKQRVPGILLKPAGASGRLPVVIAMHGTGGNKEDRLAFCRKLVAQGFMTVAIDGRYHGERTKAGTGADEYNEAIVRAWQGNGEHPFYYDTVWDITRLIDYLETREDVDAKRIGLTGSSKGGIETYLAAGVDERIAVAAPWIGVQSFHWALEHNAWQGRIATIQSAFDTIAKAEAVTNVDAAFVRCFYDRVVPKIDSEFDGPQMLRRIAPRPLLVVGSDGDKNCPLPGVELAVGEARVAYRHAKAADRFVAIIQPKTGHAVKPESEAATVEWFVKWLKP